MKNKNILIVGTLFLLLSALVIGGNYYQKNLENQSAATTIETSASEETTTESSQEEVRTQTQEKMTEIYVDPKLYSTTEVTENDYVKLRKEAKADSPVVEKVHRGEWAAFLDETGDWVKIKTNLGKEGYIPKKNARTQEIIRNSLPQDLQGLKIVLDPGHGGIDTGAESLDGKTNEKTLTLSTAKKIGALLENAGVTVSYTRDQDELISLTEIAKFSKTQNPDLFISLHYDNNDIPNGWSGTTTYYYYERDKKLAETVSGFLAKDVPLSSNGVRQGNYFVIRESFVPSLLLELGYLNSDKDLANIRKDGYQEQVAEAVVAGVRQYLLNQAAGM